MKFVDRLFSSNGLNEIQHPVQFNSYHKEKKHSLLTILKSHSFDRVKNRMFNRNNKQCQKSNKRQYFIKVKSLRGGGCGTSKHEKKLYPQQDYIENSKSTLPHYFMKDFRRHLNIIIDSASLAYDEREKEQIMITIQWFIAMQECFNILCKDKTSAAATYDLIFECLPKLLKSTVTYLRISGFLCLQIFYIINTLARVIFTFFMTNEKRFMKIQDKELLEELIAEFETQLYIETQNIWEAGAEFELTMLKAVIQSSPSNSDEGQKLLISFIGGLVKSCLTMSPTDDLIDSLINGDKFLHKAYQTNNLKKKYEVDYYFQSLKWQIIQLLKQDYQPQNIIKYLVYAYKTYIENQNDWLLNFCWIRLIASLLSYRPIIQKQEISNILNEQQKIWNLMIKQKTLSQFSFNKNIGRLQFLKTMKNHQINQFSDIVERFRLQQFDNFNELLLRIVNCSSKQYFSLIDSSLGKIQIDYLSLLFEKDQNLNEHIIQQEKIQEKIQEYLKNINENLKNFQKMNKNLKERSDFHQIISFDIKSTIEYSFRSLAQTIQIRYLKQLQVFKNNLIIESIATDSTIEDLQQKTNLQQQTEIIMKNFQETEKDDLVLLIENQTKLINELVSLEIHFVNNQQNQNEIDQNILEMFKNIEQIFQENKSKRNKFCQIDISLKNINQEQTYDKQQKIEKQMDQNIKYGKILQFRLNHPLYQLEKKIQTLLNTTFLELKISNIFRSHQNYEQEQMSLTRKIICLNTLQYQLHDLISQMAYFKEISQKINQFFENNKLYLQMFQEPNKQPIKDEKDVIDMLKTQLQTILQFFFRRRKTYY